MTSRFTELVIDCHDPRRLADFWMALLGYEVLDERDDLIEIAAWEPTVEAVLALATPPTLIFVQVPESKSIKNRLHLDLSPVDNSHAEEIDRALQLGATRVDVGQGEQPWEVLADPEGNEFCILRSLAPDNPDRPDRA